MARCALCGNTEPCRGEGFPHCKEEKDIDITEDEKQDNDTEMFSFLD